MSETEFWIINIISVQKNDPSVTGSQDQIGQTIEAFEEGCLPTSGWTENGKDLFGSNTEVNIPKGLDGIVVEAEIFDSDLVFLKHDFLRPDDEYND
jgi:hypothetical protein